MTAISSTYKTPAEFDRALKKAAKSAEGDTGERYRQALRDRFLCRVFSDSERRFILKGGSGLLARVPNARATRDADFALRRREDPDAIIEILDGLLSLDLGDFCRFELTRREESMDENGYSRLLRLRYTSYIGEEEKDPVLVDLSLDCELTVSPETVAPANRLALPNVEVCDYLVCSVEDQLADKLCAIMEVQPNGWPSSRMKDLADVVAYALTQAPRANVLASAISNECRRRSMKTPECFAAPEEWRTSYAAFSRKVGSPDVYQSFEEASLLASKLFDPVLSRRVAHSHWDAEMLDWR